MNFICRMLELNASLRGVVSPRANCQPNKKGTAMKKVLSSMIMAVAVAFGALAADGYIESDGASGILTDYKLKPTSRVEVDFALTTTDQGTAGVRLFGADYSHTALGLSASLYVGGSENSLWVIHLGNGSAYDSVWPKDGNGNFVSLDTDRHTAVIDFPNPPHLFITGSVTNEIPNEDFTPESFINEATKPIALFARQNASGVFEKQSKARIYGARIFENGSLVRDYVPCVKDGMPGFKDTVGGGFFCNPAAETHFTSGGDVLVEESPYVATPTGNSTDASKHLYIDTLYYATSETRFELDYALTETRPSGATWYIFSGESQFGSFINDKGAGFVVKTSQWKTTVAASVANIVGVRRTAILDAPAKKCGIVTAAYTNDCQTITTNGVFANTSTLKIASYAGANNYFASMKIYGCRIYESGALVRDFRPCVIGPDQDGSAIVGLKDEITGAFVTYPAATASKRLSCGGSEPIPAPPYVKTLRSASQYIKTGYQANGNTKASLDYAPAENRTAGDTWYLFWGKDTGIFSAYVNNNGFGFINDSGTWKGSIGASCNPDSIAARRTVTLDNAESMASISTDFGKTATQAMPGPGSLSFSRLELQLGANLPAANFASMRIYGFKIWEKENGEYVLKRDYVPAVVDNVAGLQDIMPDGEFKSCVSTASSQLTYGGAFKPAVTQSAATVKHGETATLTASAPSAASYRWLKNGEPIDGATGDTLAATYGGVGVVDSYQAIAVYTIDEATMESDPSAPVTIEGKASATTIIIR